jgi:hypothetical protein
MLFDDVAAFEAPPAPFVADQRMDLRRSRVPNDAIGNAMAQALLRDYEAWKAYTHEYGTARFIAQSMDGARDYLELWAASEMITRRRFYRGVKALTCVTAYSMRLFWDTVGYEGPLLGRRG